MAPDSISSSGRLALEVEWQSSNSKVTGTIRVLQRPCRGVLEQDAASRPAAGEQAGALPITLWTLVWGRDDLNLIFSPIQASVCSVALLFLEISSHFRQFKKHNYMFHEFTNQDFTTSDSISASATCPLVMSSISFHLLCPRVVHMWKRHVTVQQKLFQGVHWRIDFFFFFFPIMPSGGCPTDWLS